VDLLGRHDSRFKQRDTNGEKVGVLLSICKSICSS